MLVTILENCRKALWTLSIVFMLSATCLGQNQNAQDHPTTVTPVPAVVGPIPVTLFSHPLDSASHSDQAFRLEAYGYVEREYFVSGLANVYSWLTDGTVKVRTSNAPYSTRILVWMPKDSKRFSGNVIVNLMNPNGVGLDILWPQAREYVLAHGDAWIGLTIYPSLIKSLKVFDPARYAPLSMANPEPYLQGCTNPDADPTGEPGLAWDIISQVGALVKSDSPRNPFAGYKVERAYLTSHTAGDLPLYVDAIAPIANIAPGKPVYDGYVIQDSGLPGRMNQCEVRVQPGDPRTFDRASSAPVFRVSSESDPVYQEHSYAFRRQDGDAPNDRYRLYEVPGSDEGQPFYFFPALSTTDVLNAGGTYPVECPLGERNDFPLGYIMDGVYANLDRWVRTGKTPPKAEPIALTASGKTAIGYQYDEFGNAKGGVRTPYVDVPIATYVLGCPVDGKGFDAKTRSKNRGYKAPFDKETLKRLYPTHNDYVNKVNAEVDLMVRDGWLVQMDAEKIKAEAATANVPE
jgi:Alpha/beta hydrolase domain